MQTQKGVPKATTTPVDIERGASELDAMVVLPYSINVVHPDGPHMILGFSPTPELEVVKMAPDEVEEPKDDKEIVDVIPPNFSQKWGTTILVSCIGKSLWMMYMVLLTVHHI